MALSKNTLKDLRALTHRKFRDDQKKFIVEGVRLVQEALESDFPVLEAYYTQDLAGDAAGRALLARLKGKTRELHVTSSREMDLISETVSFQGVLAVLPQKHYAVESIVGVDHPASLIVAFDAVADPGNLGTMVRTCDWFGVNGILLGRNSVELYNPKVIRSTMGGIFHLPIAAEVDLLPALTYARECGYRVFVTDLNGEAHFDHVRFPQKTLLVFGNEAWGVSDQLKQLADVRLSIRRYGAAESLNVSVACGVVLSATHRLYDWRAG